MWIGLADLLLCILSVVIVAVAPTKAKVDGIKPKAEFLITPTGRWPFDIDLWLVSPRENPSFMGRLRDWMHRSIATVLAFRPRRSTLADRSTARSGRSDKETATIGVCASHYDIGVNLYSDRELAKGANAIPVRVEIAGLNPEVTTLFAGKRNLLDQVGQTINVVSFDLTFDGKSNSPTRRSSRIPMPTAG
jgi:hypothetical protein